MSGSEQAEPCSSARLENMKYPTEAGIVHLEAETEKNEFGKQFFWAHWVGDGRRRGQAFFADMDKHIGYWKDRGWKVIVEQNAGNQGQTPRGETHE